MRGIDGVTLTAQVKEDVMGRLKLAMEHGKLTLPRDDTRLLVQITSQRCEPKVRNAKGQPPNRNTRRPIVEPRIGDLRIATADPTDLQTNYPILLTFDGVNSSL